MTKPIQFPTRYCGSKVWPGLTFYAYEFAICALLFRSRLCSAGLFQLPPWGANLLAFAVWMIYWRRNPSYNNNAAMLAIHRRYMLPEGRITTTTLKFQSAEKSSERWYELPNSTRIQNSQTRKWTTAGPSANQNTLLYCIYRMRARCSFRCCW